MACKRHSTCHTHFGAGVERVFTKLLTLIDLAYLGTVRNHNKEFKAWQASFLSFKGERKSAVSFLKISVGSLKFLQRPFLLRSKVYRQKKAEADWLIFKNGADKPI